jgi:hypothetical protein
MEMGWFLYFWKMTPAEYKSLTVEEHKAMVDVMTEIGKQRKRAANKRR